MERESIDVKLARLQESTEASRSHSRAQSKEIAELKAELRHVAASVQDIRMDLHAAKVGGRWSIGVALAAGSLFGWIIKLALEHGGNK